MSKSVKILLAIGAVALAVLIVCLSLLLFLHFKKGPSWQEQYDLGIRYLSEGNYEEAIIAFTAAIEIDPRQSLPYIGRGDAYIGSGETAGNLTAAQVDYEKAITLDERNADAWLGLADVYIRQGQYEEALALLEEAADKVSDDSRILDKIQAMRGGTFADSKGRTRKSVRIVDGQVTEYWLYEYDEKGNNIWTLNYDMDGTLDYTEYSEFDERGLEIKLTRVFADDGSTTAETYEYDSTGRRIRETTEGGATTLISYDDEKRTETHNSYKSDGTLSYQSVIEYDENWIKRKSSIYSVDENGKLYLDYYTIFIWNEDGSYGGYEHFQVAEK